MKNDIITFRYICTMHGMTDEQRYKFSEYIHKLKSQGYIGSAAKGDFTKDELNEHADDFLGNSDAQKITKKN